jgi:hypothetical protein
MGSGPTESIQSKIKIKPQHRDLGSEAQLDCATLALALSQRERGEASGFGCALDV